MHNTIKLIFFKYIQTEYDLLRFDLTWVKKRHSLIFVCDALDASQVERATTFLKCWAPKTNC